MRNLKRMLLCAVATMAIVAGVAASPASASAPDGTVPSTGYKTQDANVPYLAWQGEHVRLVACRSGDAFPATTTASWMLVDPLNWPDFAPAVDPFTVKVVGNCVIGTWISDKPGIAALQVILHDAAGANIYEKQFLVGWMELLKPAVVGGGNVDAADFCNARALETLSAEYLRLTGPFSNCYHDPQDPRHRIQVTVKGNLPLEADFQKWGLGDHLVLPDDWGRSGSRSGTHDLGQRSAQGDVQLGHPRRLADDRGSRQDLRQAVPGPEVQREIRRVRRR